MCKHTKAHIMAWLASKHIPHVTSQTSAELLQLVMKSEMCKCYELDIICMRHCHTVVKLILYHCHYNTAEMIHAQLKSYVAAKNNTIGILYVVKC